MILALIGVELVAYGLMETCGLKVIGHMMKMETLLMVGGIVHHGMEIVFVVILKLHLLLTQLVQLMLQIYQA
jgi:hypothetical protein